ncbi:protein kinase domain-containing protein [Streptomyces rhizosphaerihabitans]|uniref:serine/threonine-protein kinase n=1 Tax=Streptomyces rhizosphaerihabitans TaxID=1266770 RepID=UPI0021BE898F|nr:serine/threonine-protein kinase [Streptomyces rhizosphaerihabitans]MCT9006238.1 PQQ-binding-like beta-propeller repeat protein [Streptomyces rhizosphaerihabitans]
MPPQRSTGTDSEAEHPRYAGQYLLEARLGSGGMGIVHLARSASGLRLAVKVVHAEFSQDPEFRGRFRQEVAAARRVSGAFTAPVVDADPGAEHPWMATLFIPGPTLAEHVKRNGALSSARLRHLMAGLAEALRDIHRAGVVHRDLKPSNVLLAEDGPKVIDFGISRPADSELRTETGKLIGTPPFMAPEQFSRPRHVGPAADVFALGSVIVHAATGSGPFDSDSPYLVAYQVVHDEPDLTGVPEDLVGLVSRCLAKEPEDRPTPDELMVALRSVSASYDTRAFIPEQRAGKGESAPPAQDSDSRPRVPRPRHERPQGAEDRTHVAARKRGGRGRRLPAVIAVTGLAVAGGAVGAFGLLGGSQSPVAEHHTARPSKSTFQPWERDLRASGAEADGQPRCTYAPRALLCVRPGVLATAIDPDDGEVLWSRSDTGNGSSYSTPAPVFSGGLLLVGSRSGNRLTALDPATGATRWTRDVARYDGRVTHVAGVVLLTGPDSKVTALDAATGEEKWRHAIPGLAVPQFQSYGDGLVYVVSPPAPPGSGTGTRVTAVDPTTGATTWQRRMDGALSLVAARGGTVWFTSTTVDQYTDSVLRYDVAKRRIHRTTLRIPQAQTQVAVQGDTAYLLGSDGSLVAVNTRTSEQLWRVETSVSRASAPTVAGHRLCLTAADGRLIAVDTDRGTLLGQTKTRLGSDRGSLVSVLPAPLAADGHIYATAPDGSLFAVDTRDPSAW